MSKLRPEMRTADPRTPCLYNGDALYAVYGAVEGQSGLIHGKLHNGRGEHCAIGSYFDAAPHMALPESLIDEVAAINDAVPHATPKQRKAFVSRWLKWKLTKLGVPGFKTHANPAAK